MAEISPLSVRQFSLSKDNKWEQPGWRIEQRYRKGVLVGNWSEDRHDKFFRGRDFGNSTSREAFQLYSSASYKPDPTTRRKGLIRSDGLNKKQMFSHHGDRYHSNTISMYDQTFNKRYWHGPRYWDGKRMAWLPEASDNPMQGEGTKFGLKEQLEEKWRKQRELEDHGEFITTSRLSYKAPTMTSYVTQRAATSRDISGHTHPHSINKDLHFRNIRPILFKETVDPQLLTLKQKTKSRSTHPLTSTV